MDFFQFLFLFYYRKKEHKMNDKIFSKSIKVLIVVTLIILAFFKGNVRDWLLIGFTAVWLVISVIRLSKKFANRSENVPQKKTRSRKISRKEAKQIQMKKTLLMHLNYRITDKLRSVYPDSTWNWVIRSPEKLAECGGVGRIRTTNTGEFTHAEIRVDSFANVEFTMLKLSPLEEQTNPPPSPDDAKLWYQMYGKELFVNAVTDLNTRGYKRLEINEAGEIIVGGEKQDEIENPLRTTAWESLVKILGDDGLNAHVEDNKLVLEW